MKKVIVLILLFIGSFANAQNVGINSTGAAPNPAAMLDVSSTNKGFLPPRMTSAQRTSIPTPMPANGLVVFDTDTQSLWIIRNGAWVNLAAAWSLNGNAGTTATNFIGTTDSQPLRFTVNNIPSGIISGINQIIGLGRNALLNNSGNVVIAIGTGTLQNNTGQGNVAVGFNALQENTSGSDNIALGQDVLKTNTIGNFNVGIGSSALRFNTTGQGNIAIGYRSLDSNSIGSDNIAIGNGTLARNTTGEINSAIGAAALALNTTGSYNNAWGYQSLWKNQSGYSNVAVGVRSLQENTIGYKNVAIGIAAMQNNISGYLNTAVGDSSLFYNTTSNSNIAIGNSSLLNNTTGYSNAAIGTQALYSNKISTNLVAVGDSALYHNGIGVNPALPYQASHNTAIGSKSLFSNGTGFGNTATGSRTLFNNTSGSYNTAMGERALSENTFGDSNTSLGANSLFNSKFGNNNTAIGAYALYNNVSGTGNIAIGNEAGFFENDSHKLYIESSNSTVPLIYGEFDNDIVKINGQLKVHQVAVVENEMQINNTSLYNHSSGAQYFGTGLNEFIISSQEAIDESGGIYGDGNTVTIWSPGDGNLGAPAALVYFVDDDAFDATPDPYDNSGLRSYITPAGAYMQVSDLNKKENIKKIENSLEKINQISGYTYQFKLFPDEIKKGDKQVTCSGVLAQELEKVLPEAVRKSIEGDYFVDYAAITPLLIEAIKEQQLQIQNLQKNNDLIFKANQNLKDMLEDQIRENISIKAQNEAIILLLSELKQNLKAEK
jgi:trimeric autotransporter adhesin